MLAKVQVVVASSSSCRGRGRCRQYHCGAGAGAGVIVVVQGKGQGQGRVQAAASCRGRCRCRQHCCCCHASAGAGAGAGEGHIVDGIIAIAIVVQALVLVGSLPAGIVMPAWMLCCHGCVVHAGHHRMVMVVLLTLLLGCPGGYGGGCIVDTHLHQMPVVGGPRGDGGKGCGGVWGLVWTRCCHGRGWVVDVADLGHPGGQTVGDRTLAIKMYIYMHTTRGK